MAYSYVSYLAETSQSQFTVPFDYLDKSHVKVKVNGELVDSFSWASDTQIQLLTVAPADRIYIFRETSPEQRLVDFVLPGQLTEEDLDTAFEQIHKLSQEAVDQSQLGIYEDVSSGAFSVKGRVLSDLADPISDTDAVSKQYADSVRADSETRHTDIVTKHTEVIIKTSDVTQIRDELYGLTTHLTSLPYGSTGSVNYDVNTGELTFSLSEGPQGPVGGTGPAGSTGPQGPDGPQGVIGPEGPIGPQGELGNTGPTGDQGVTGIQGVTGETGPVGPTGIQGVMGDQGPIGFTGSTGSQGPEGDAGPMGPTGSTGTQGPTGDTGSQGPEGDAGPVGPTGSTGVKGSTGDTGSQGPVGNDGPLGPTGPQGPIGFTGPVGPLGPQGIQGDLGNKGPDGDQGPLGPQGSVGSEGPQGPTSLGLAFGRFHMDPVTGVLAVDYYGSANDQDFNINSNGELEITI